MKSLRSVSIDPINTITWLAVLGIGALFMVSLVLILF